MNIFTTVCACAAIFIGHLLSHSQAIEYLTRVQNVTLKSETDSCNLMNFTTFHTHAENKTHVQFNITKDISIKTVQIVVYRCAYEKNACEYFLKWTFQRNDLKSIVHMKNQMWTPAFANIRPRLDIPIMRRGTYENDDLKFDGKAVIAFYPDATDYYHEAEIDVVDVSSKKAIKINLEAYILPLVQRGVKRNFRNSTRKSSHRTPNS